VSLLNWQIFENLPGSPSSNFEYLCRALVRLQYGRFGQFEALANQPGVEFHLRLSEDCALGKTGQWFGWQCRWYDLASGKAIGATRRKKIIDALSKTEQALPELTDWVLCTRHPLTKGDQKWFKGLSKTVRLHQWTSADVETHLSGDAIILRATYFGDLILTPDSLAVLHKESVARVQGRWLPEAHQTIEAERTLRRILVQPNAWDQLQKIRAELRAYAKSFESEPARSAPVLTSLISELKNVAKTFGAALRNAQQALASGDLEALGRLLCERPPIDNHLLSGWLRQLRACHLQAALFATNLVANIRLSDSLLSRMASSLDTRVVSVLAGPGGGKTQLSAQLTAANQGRSAGILLHGQDFNANQSVDDLARRVSIHGVPVSNMEALVAALDAAGLRNRNRLPIVIDGLNEAEDPRKWKAAIASLNETLRKYPNVVLICTVRTEEFADESLPDHIERLEIPDFGEDTFEAIGKYFEYYKINPADADLPIELLSTPLTLRLFCDVTNPSRKEYVAIEAIPGSLTGLFDRYLEHATARIAELAPKDQRYYPQDVRSAINELGKALWRRNARNLNEREFRQLLGDDSRPWDKSLVRALEQEGVILRFSGSAPAQWIGPPGHRQRLNPMRPHAASKMEPHIAPIYDALAGHIIADALTVQNGSNALGSWLKESEVIIKLNGESVGRHPLGTDVLRALVGLVPRRLHGQQLWPLVDEPMRTIALREATKLEAAYLDQKTIAELHLLTSNSKSDAAHIFSRLWHTRGASKHPLNAEFLDSVLRPMAMAKRDLSWTECVRHGRDQSLTDVQALEGRWREASTRSPASRLRAIWLMWTLTTTVRSLRDYATRALYWFGRCDPETLFSMALESLAIDDPYVPERMLAAAYGTAMALHKNPSIPRFAEEILPNFAVKLYGSMFEKEALYATTHALMRDYARHIINLALLKTRDLLGSSDKKRVYPPFPGLPKKTWGKVDVKYSGGYGGPIRMDFGNYTIGHLVQGRGNYQFEHPEYQSVMQSILWRIYDLGYSDKLESIDNELGEEDWRHGRAGNAGKIDRYGKKYSWIAYFEMAGRRQDEGKLREWYGENGRLSDIDIDPSFPDPVRERSVVPVTLEDGVVSPAEWLKRRDPPPIKRLLIQSEPFGCKGRWVLIDGYFHQRDVEHKIGLVCYIRNVLVAEPIFPELKTCLLKHLDLKSLYLQKPSFHYTFVGEAGWADTYPACGAAKMSFQVGQKTVRRKRGPLDDFIGAGSVASRDAVPQTANERRSKYVTFEQPICRTVRVTIPVVDNRWESYHTVTNSGDCPALLGREVCTTLNLHVDPRTSEFYDSSGKLASLVIKGDPPLNASQEFIFLRKDLYDEFLRTKRMRSVWLVWGERDLDTGNVDELRKLYEEHGVPGEFNAVVRYPSLGSL
jgi:hypothetical protein